MRELQGKNVQNQYFWSFLMKEAIKNFSQKIFLDNNMTNPLKKSISKNVYKRRMTLSAASSSSFSDYLYTFSFKFFEAVL